MRKIGILGKSKRFLRRATSFSLAGLMLASAFVGTDIYYNYGSKVYAAELVGASNGTSGDQTIKGAQNLGKIDNSANTTYWYAGNAFYGMVREGTEFGENYDPSDWLLVDTDAMWGGNYLYSTWGNAYRSDGSDLYTYSDDQANNNYYFQKILTYGERLWSQYGTSWFTGQEAGAVGTADVTTTNNSYRTYEKYVSGATNDIGNYNYWIGATTADAIASGNYTVDKVKKWYETGSTDTTKYGTLSAAQNAATYINATNNYINSSNYNGITEASLGVKSSNIYSVLGAHLYAPSVGELESNETVYKKIVQNLRNDYTAETTDTGGWAPNGGWYSAAKSKANANPSAHLWDRTRTHLWSRSFSGLHVNSGNLGAWLVDVNGNLYSGSNLASSHAVAPAFNLDTDSVVMARSAQATVSPSSELASYNPNDLGSDVEFSLESNALKINTAIAGQTLKNVVAGQTYDIAYSDASTSGEVHNSAASATLYVSAGIYDENNNLVYYGQLAQVDGSGAGTVSLTVPEGLAAGKEYKLAIFEEQINGSYNITTPAGNSIVTYTTNYVSPMNIATFTLDALSAEAKDGASLKEETSYSVNDIADMITVTSATQGELTFGTDYTIKSVKGNATVDGTTITTGDNGSKNSRELTFEITYVDENMAIVPGTTVTLTVNSSNSVDDNTYQGDQNADTDENGFYSWTDKESGIVWKYKTDSSGNVVSLYTTNDPSPLIDAAGILNLPKTVAGLTVVGVGGGSESTPVVSMGDGDWTGISFPETVTTINDYAFANARQQSADIIIPKYITTIGAKAFYKSTIRSLKVNGMTGNIGYLAFGGCKNLSSVVLRGIALTVDKEAFNNAGITNLSITGTVFIKENAFKDVTEITSLYLPNGVDAYANAFSGCTGIKTFETGMSVLYNDAFSGCTSIDTVILDDTVEKIEYDWNGHASDLDRTFYIKNGDTKFQFYGKDGSYISAYGTAGNVRVVYDDGNDEGTELVADDKGILTAITRTLASHANKYEDYYKGQAASVSYVYNGAKSTEQIMEEDSVGDVNIVSEMQTGIEVTFNGTLLTTQPIDKSKVNVTALFGSALGATYDKDHFYVIRSEEFNSLSREGGVTEEAVAAFEPLTVQSSDLKNGLSAAIIVFTSAVNEGEGVKYNQIEDGSYFYATISVRVEEYSDKDYVESEYGSYTEIVKEINSLTNNIATMEESMKNVITKVNAALGTAYDVNADDLVSEYQNAVQALSDALTEAVAKNESSVNSVKKLLDSVNAIYGTSITIDDNATAEQMNNAVSEAMDTILADQTAKNNKIKELTEQYVEIAKMLSDYMSDADNLKADAVNGTTIANIKAAIAKALSDLNAANKELTAINSALVKLTSALEAAYASIGIKPPTPSTGDSTADQLEAAAEMVSTITDAYNKLNESYGNLQNEYNAIINYVYGDSSSTDGVTADQIKEQIDKNQQDAIDAAVEAALKNAETLNKDAETVQNAIGEAIDAILDGKDVSTAGMTEELASALGNVQNMKANVDSMQSAIDGYKSVLATIKGALGLDDTATSTEILAAITGLKEQVATLSAQVQELQTENASLKTQLAGDGSYKAGFEAGVASVDVSENSEIYKKGYAAGFSAGNKNTSDSTDSKITELLSQVSTLTEKNKTLSSNVSSLKTDNTSLKNEVSTLTGANKSLTSKVDSLNSTITSLTNNKNNLSSEVSSLRSQVDALQKAKTTTSSTTSNTANTGTSSTGNGTSNTAGSGNGGTSSSSTTAARSNTTSTTAASAISTSGTSGAQSSNKNSVNATSSTEDEIKRNTTLVTPQSTDERGEDTKELSLPSSSEINKVVSSQKAEVSLQKLLGDGNVANVKTNAKNLNVATSGQKDMAYLILNYYMNHLDELGELGSDKIKAAATNENATVSFEVVSAFDVEPSEEQAKEMSDNGSANLVLTSDSFENGGLYLVIHESEQREDTYDVLLTELEDNTISMNLPDFSPVTVAKIDITEKENVGVTENIDTENVQLIAESDEEQTASNNGFRIVMYILIVFVFVVLGIMFVLIKKNPDFKFDSFKKNKK